MDAEFLNLFSTGVCLGIGLGFIPFIIGSVVHGVFSLLGGNTDLD